MKPLTRLLHFPWKQLTPREQQIVLLVSEKLSNELIAGRLGLHSRC